MQTIIDIDKSPENTWQRVIGIFGTDKILLIASGEVVAGVDLGKIKPTDIRISKNSIFLKIPPAEIFHTRINNQETRVYLREKGLLYPYDKDLETIARQQAEENLTDWALQHDILEKARVNAIAELQRFLQSLGFTHITINTRAQ